MQLHELIQLKIVSSTEIFRKVNQLRVKSKKIGFTNGCFDLLHAGHIHALTQSKSQVDVLIVGLNTDASIRINKGEHRPIINEQFRASMIAALLMVNYVVLFDEPTPLPLIKIIQPDVLIKGEDYRDKEIVGADFVQSYGGRVYLHDLAHELSTTKIIQKIKSI